MSFLFDIASLFTYANQAGIARKNYESFTETDPEKRKLAAEVAYCYDKLNLESIKVNLTAIFIPLFIIMLLIYFNPNFISNNGFFIAGIIISISIYLIYYNYYIYNTKLYELRTAKKINHSDCSIVEK